MTAATRRGDGSRAVLLARPQQFIVVAKLDVDANPVIAERYGVRAIPTLLFFRAGRLMDIVVGALPRRELVERLDGGVERL